MAVHDAMVAAGHGQLGHHILVGEDDPGIVHHFGQGHDAWMVEKGRQIPGIEAGTGSFHVRGRHTGGQREQAVHGLALG